MYESYEDLITAHLTGTPVTEADVSAVLRHAETSAYEGARLGGMTDGQSMRYAERFVNRVVRELREAGLEVAE